MSARNKFIRFVFLIACLSAASTAWALTSDVTLLFTITRSGFVYNRATNTFDATVALTNTSSSSIRGPVWFVLDGLPTSVELANRTGLTEQGKPYIALGTSTTRFDPAARSTSVLKFLNPTRTAIHFSVFLLAPWPTDGNATLGMTIQSPPAWYPTLDDGGNTLVLRNVEQPAPLSELKFQTESAFHVFRRRGWNPLALSVGDWFTQFSTGGFPTEIKSQQYVFVGQRPAVRIVLSEIGGDRVHIYAADGTDIVEISYGLYAPQFVSDYEAMLGSISFQ